jgi:serine/threonine protein phosphatase PrpC
MHFVSVLTVPSPQFHATFAEVPETIPTTHKYSAVAGCGYSSDRGRRPTMEDSELMLDRYFGSPDAAFFAVYDGHGGRETVDFVVRSLHSNVASELRKHGLTTADMAAGPEQSPDAVESRLQQFRDVFEQAYRHTDAQLRRSAILRSGTTSVTCLINYIGSRRFISAANVGDSRAVLCRNGKAIRMTIDHKASVPEEVARITRAGGFVTPNHRVNGVLAISRALGDHMLKENDVVTCSPYCQHAEVQPRDSLLILACDGVWDVMEDQDAVDIALEVVARECATAAANRGLDTDNYLMEKFGPGPHNHPAERVMLGNLVRGEALNRALVSASKRIVDEAFRRHTNDNITVMVILL